MNIDETLEEKLLRPKKELAALERKLIKSEKGLCFWFGVVFYLCVDALYQDFLGKEAYLKLIQASWINIPWQIWLIPMILTLYAHHKIKQGNE